MKEYLAPAFASLSISFTGYFNLLNPLLEHISLLFAVILSGMAIYNKFKGRKKKAEAGE